MEERYLRHIQLENIGKEGQEKISRAKVLVVGAGGLGCPALQYLCAAGVGTLGIMDHDTVERSNLQRQILFTESDIGHNKAEVAQRHLRKINSQISIHAHSLALTSKNAMEIIGDYDLVIDGTDRLSTRYLISDTCLLLNKVMVYGALFKFEGQVSVFNYRKGPSYRCLFPKPPEEGEIPNCSETGILGVLPGTIGVLQATETLKVILNLGEILSGKLLCMNLLTHQQTQFHFKRKEQEIKKVIQNKIPLSSSIENCFTDFQVSLNQIEKDEEIMWVDIREENELPKIRFKHLTPIPMSQSHLLHTIKGGNKKIVLFCQTGLRSQIAVQKLRASGSQNCFSLEEGAEVLNQWQQNQWKQ